MWVILTNKPLLFLSTHCGFCWLTIVFIKSFFFVPFFFNYATYQEPYFFFNKCLFFKKLTWIQKENCQSNDAIIHISGKRKIYLYVCHLSLAIVSWLFEVPVISRYKVPSNLPDHCLKAVNKHHLLCPKVSLTINILDTLLMWVRGTAPLHVTEWAVWASHIVSRRKIKRMGWSAKGQKGQPLRP